MKPIRTTLIPMGYFLFYTASCNPTVAEFASAQERSDFIANFVIEFQGEDDFWIDAIVDGTVQILPNTGTVVMPVRESSDDDEDEDEST